MTTKQHPEFDSPLPDRPFQTELESRILACIDEAIGDMNLTTLEIIGALEVVKLRWFTMMLESEEEDDDE